jgi:hypothetical protein
VNASDLSVSATNETSFVALDVSVPVEFALQVEYPLSREDGCTVGDFGSLDDCVDLVVEEGLLLIGDSLLPLLPLGGVAGFTEILRL